MRRLLCAIATLGVLGFSTSVGSATSTTQSKESPSKAQALPCSKDIETTPGTPRRVLATAAAVVPGLILNGTGHWVAGHPCTARKLLLAETVGLTSLGIGISTLALTGGSQYLATPATLFSMAGLGIVITTIGADIYGASGAANHAGEPSLRRPIWEAELGLMYVYNPMFDFSWLLTQRATASVDRVSFSGGLDTTVIGAHARYRLGTALRIVGPRTNTPARDGSYFDLRTEFGEQRFTTMGFVTDAAEVTIAGRFDLGRYGSTLRGSFSEMSAGLLLSRTSYRIDGISVKPDYGTMLLSRVGFGVYLGHGVRRGSEATFYYDHRRDDYAAGMKFWGYGNGMAGHVGLSSRFFFSKHLGVNALYEVGSSHVFGLSLVFRAGERS